MYGRASVGRPEEEVGDQVGEVIPSLMVLFGFQMPTPMSILHRALSLSVVQQASTTRTRRLEI